MKSAKTLEKRLSKFKDHFNSNNIWIKLKAHKIVRKSIKKLNIECKEAIKSGNDANFVHIRINFDLELIADIVRKKLIKLGYYCGYMKYDFNQYEYFLFFGLKKEE